MSYAVKSNENYAHNKFNFQILWNNSSIEAWIVMNIFDNIPVWTCVYSFKTVQK